MIGTPLKSGVPFHCELVKPTTVGLFCKMSCAQPAIDATSVPAPGIHLRLLPLYSAPASCISLRPSESRAGSSYLRHVIRMPLRRLLFRHLSKRRFLYKAVISPPRYKLNVLVQLLKCLPCCTLLPTIPGLKVAAVASVVRVDHIIPKQHSHIAVSRLR